MTSSDQSTTREQRLEPIYVTPSTRERFEKHRKDTKNEHVPELVPDGFLETLLDTYEAVEQGYYSEVRDQ